MDNISVSELKDFTFCKAIPWIKRKLGWKEPTTISQQLGKKINLREITRDFPDPKYYEVYLKDKKTGISGVVDVIAGNSVVEVKAFKRRHYSHFRIQLLAYAYLADRNGFRVRDAVLMMNQEVKLRIEVNKEHVNYVEKLAQELAETLEDDSPPTVNQPLAKCKACQYRKVCPVSNY